MSTESTPYRDLSGRADFPAIEQEILGRWKAEGTFERSIAERPADDEFVFYDGPPFANGLPHHGHLLTGFVKDVVPRYQTMRGKRVDRRFGWDCHGLPAEMESEKQLGVSGRAAITEYGIEKFNDHCRTSVMRYTNEWETTVERQARWVDFENDYKTMDLPYMESVMWAFKQLYDKGLIYQAHRVMPYSWGAETPLSNFEIRLDDATRPRQDPALTVAFRLTDDAASAADVPSGTAVLAWTTTPWTLPSNQALAVGPDLAYVVVATPDGLASPLDGSITHVLLAEAALGRYARELGDDPEIVTTVTGADLVGATYTPLLPYFADHEDSFRVLGGDFIETSDGTGVVHMAPGFGEDDQRVGEANGIALVVPVDDEGKFTDEVPDFAGMNVFDANPEVIARLKTDGVVVRHETYDHNYPHCWRTDTPIIYRAMPSWYVEVTAIRDRLMELNQEINWVPGHIRDGRFGMWLDGARDWSISRNRFWGSPVPVWMSDDPAYPRIDVYGSLDELEADFGVRPDDLHRPSIDRLTRPNPDDPTGNSTMRRVPEVLDCWFESGSMPFAQVHYPFENAEWFESHFPADFIVEYINQTRGWFYTLHVLAGALFDRPAFQNVICHGILLAEDGAKLSKKLRNYTEPTEIFEAQGADALRWYFMSSNIVRGGDARISDQGIDEVTRQVLLPIRNAVSFFTLYANAEGYTASERTDSTHVLDRYLLAKTHAMVVDVTTAMEAYDLPGACASLQGFIDALNNWYIRRSRDRFWGTADTGDGDTAAAMDTLYTVLRAFVSAAAPFLPMITEDLWDVLSGSDAGDANADSSSVHLQPWPDADAFPADPALVAAMDRTRDVASAGLGLREAGGLRVRLPLASATVAGRGVEALAPFVDLIADELNVKTVELTEDVARFGTFSLRPNGRLLGPKLGGTVQHVIKAAKTGNWTASADGSTVAVSLEDGSTVELTGEEFDLGLDPVEGVTAAPLPGNDAVVALDAVVTPELEAEGLARDIVRHVQQARRDADLVVTDRIDLSLTAPADVLAAVESHRDWVMEQVLATEMSAEQGEQLAVVVQRV